MMRIRSSVSGAGIVTLNEEEEEEDQRDSNLISDESDDETADMEAAGDGSDIQDRESFAEPRQLPVAANPNRNRAVMEQNNGNQASIRARDIENDMERIILMEAVARGVDPVNFDEDPHALEETLADRDEQERNRALVMRVERLRRVERNPRATATETVLGPNGFQCATANCAFCTELRVNFAQNPEIRYRPSTLKMQILLEYGYKFFGWKRSGRIHSEVPLPEGLRDLFAQVCHELQTWLDQYLEVIYEASHCYIPHLHWTADGMIDRQATARMLLKSNAINVKDKFRVAAVNCLSEEEIERFWNNLTGIRRHRYATALRVEGEKIVPEVAYWIGKCAQNAVVAQAHRIPALYNAIVTKCPAAVAFFSRIVHDDEDAKQNSYVADHSFHLAIQHRNAWATRYFWRRATVDQRKSMINAAACCHVKNEFYAFELAIL